MRTRNSEYAEEMRGVAQGSRQSDEAIALLNARYELAFTLFGQDARAGEKELSEQKEEMLAVGPDGCTAFGLLPQATADRHTWLGQNWDWLEGVHGRTFVLRVRRKDKPSFVCFTEAGIVGGKMGVNECGIGLVETGLASSHDGRHPYEKPFHMRCREILDAETFEDARKPVTGTPRTCSANFVIGTAGGRHRQHRNEPRSRQRHPAGGRHPHAFKPLPDAGAWRVADGEALAQYAAPR